MDHAQAVVDRVSALQPTVESVLSVVLYLCTTAAEIRDPRDPAHKPACTTPHRDKHGRLRWYAAERATIWETGTRIGAALDAARTASHVDEADGTGRSVAPHIRRAHWHSFWLGAMDSPERRRELRWLPPIPVNVDEGDAPEVATVHPVKGARDAD
jgi:hypothetical protein